MMDTITFLTHVLPAEGVYVKTVIDGRVKQTYHDTVDALYAGIATSRLAGENVYYAVAAFNDNTSRKQDNVRALKSFFLDIDCGEGKPYATWRDGLLALSAFISDAGLPKPLIVSSGNGLHVYWVLTEELPVGEWQVIADALKWLVRAKEFSVDMAVPADSARVLRPVGTINPKGGGQVKVLIAADPVPVEVMRTALAAFTTVAVAAAPQILKRRSVLDDMAVRQEYPPCIPHVLTSKCQQLDWATTHQDKVSEPLWYAVMGIAAFCENPDATAIEWSKGHPSYNEVETLRKVNHWKNVTSGPTTCSKFETERADGCKGCKFKGKITSPARLGLQYAETPPDPTAPDAQATEVPVPWPFKRTNTGMKITIDETDVDVCKFEIYPTSYGYDETLKYEVVRFKWYRQHIGWVELVLRQSLLIDGVGREFGGALADQGIVLGFKKQVEHFQHMLRSYMDELRKMRSMTNLYATMGWKENHTQFLLGNVLIKRQPDGTIVREPISLAGSSVADILYGEAGSLEASVQFTSLLEKRKLYTHMFALGVGMSTILYDFTGISGVVINLYGPTGSGKTLAQYWQQSLWGPPKKLHFGAKFTQNAFFGRLALHNHLPVTVDETTMIPNKEIGDFIYGVSQGVDKARLSRSAEARDPKTWATAVTTSSNKSFSSALIASNMETDAQQARLMDIPMSTDPLFATSSTAGERIYQFLMANYGHIGPKMVEHFMAIGPAGVMAMIEDHKKLFATQYAASFSGEERYWRNAVVLADLCLKEAQSLGLIQFDYTAATKHVLHMIGITRKALKEQTIDSFDLIAEYLNETTATTVTVMHTGGEKGMADHSRMPRDGIHVRFDVYRRNNGSPFDRGIMLLDRKHFRIWLSTRGADYRSIINELDAERVNATPPSQKAYLGRDTPIKLPQTYVIGVNLNHPRLSGVLNDAEEAMENLTLGQLALVKD